MNITINSIRSKRQFRRFFERSIWYSPVQIDDITNVQIIRCNNDETLICNYSVKNNSAEVYMTALSTENINEAFNEFIHLLIEKHENITRITTVAFNEVDKEYIMMIDPSFNHEATLRRHVKIEGQFLDVMIFALYPWQARSFGAKRQQAETLTSPRLLLDGAFPIPPATQISSVAARCAIAIFPRAAARWSAGSVHPAPADRRRWPCGSAAPASAPAPGGTRRRPPFSLPAALQILRSGS